MIGWALTLVVLCGEPTAAERAYRDGRHADAAALFEADLAARPVASATLLYNLGNCFYRLGRPAQALLYYRRAALRAPDDADVQFNLQRTLRQLGIVEPPSSNVAALVAGVGRRSPRSLLALAAGLQTLGLAGLLFAARRSTARLGAAIALLLGLIAAAGVAINLATPATLQGVVLAREVGLRAEPHADLAARSTLRHGDTVRVAEFTDRWVRVEHATGSGWTERAGLGLVE